MNEIREKVIDFFKQGCDMELYYLNDLDLFVSPGIIEDYKSNDMYHCKRVRIAPRVFEYEIFKIESQSKNKKK